MLILKYIVVHFGRKIDVEIGVTSGIGCFDPVGSRFKKNGVLITPSKVRTYFLDSRLDPTLKIAFALINMYLNYVLPF
jgi:hypothetical protein